ncbi:hypothetical protein V6N12_051248 [Hibiscus sabdariffa]|uniref:Uncharacterized protein n=1 Tax=Hibiscus sabdariffa TaxID=183260 RepID=A0ABR2GEW3_9ROSI
MWKAFNATVVDRERNGVANKLVSLGRQQTLEGVFFTVPPGAVADLVDYEQRRREECLLVTEPTSSTCRRIDPGG